MIMVMVEVLLIFFDGVEYVFVSWFNLVDRGILFSGIVIFWNMGNIMW